MSLEAEGIDAVVKNEILSSAIGELPPAECQAEPWVLVHSAPSAQRVSFARAVDRWRALALRRLPNLKGEP